VAIKALLDAGQAKRVDLLLIQVIKLPDCNPAVGIWRMRRRIARGKWFCTPHVNRLCPKSAAARRAVIRLIESLAQHTRSIGRTVIIVYLILTIGKFLERQGRGIALLWLAWRHRRWLRTHTDAWASMGYALVTLRRFGAAMLWMRDWRQRSDLKMWMLLNLVLALRERWQRKETREVLAFAVKRPERDHTF
jgi:hypothetical protein